MKTLQTCTLIIIFTFFKSSNGNLSPVLTQDLNNFIVSENAPIGTVVYSIEATDPENGSLYYDLDGSDALSINHETGEITLVKPLDYETNSSLNVLVTIQDEVEGGKNNIVEVPVTVIVTDENDNSPKFENTPYEFTVNEDMLPGTRVFENITVIDEDSTGSNIEVECLNTTQYPGACGVFGIKTIISEQSLYQGAIILNKKLNYLEQDTYGFVLKAMDGMLGSTTDVFIKVGDVQDTPPYFTGNLTAEILENVPINTLVMIVHAADGDRGVPRKIGYYLEENPMNYFLLDSTSGELRTARPLDKESIGNPEGVLKFKIKAYELVNGKKTNDPLAVATAEAFVKIIDVNDEPPMFNKREYLVEVPENIQEGSSLPGLEMTVKDPDEGNNSAFSLDLTDVSGVFSIEPKTALSFTPVTIRVANNSLDYEDPNQRKFIILTIAREMYTSEKLSSTATVTVTVVDINDNSPTFDQESYSAVISEFASPGTPVVTIVAKDRDSGRFGENGIVYKLAGTGADKFEVNNRTGTVIVSFCETPGMPGCLDYETQSEYHLQFMATDDDGTGRTSTVPLKVTLTDTNDNAPQFTQSIYRVFINEGSVRFDPELIVEATDADKTSHLTYAIISGNDEGLFNIDSNTGKIRLVNNKGLEVRNESDNVISLRVLASDGKFDAKTVVNITILDVNNNNPIFTSESYLKSIKEDVPIGYSVLQVQATDADNGNNAVIEYFIQKGGYDDFSINNSTGIVTVSSKLDYDRKNTYNIELIAVDHGIPALTGTTTLTVNIINTNDKLPYFVPSTQTAEVMEDVLVGTVIYTLTALDPDVTSSEDLNFAATEPITALDKHGREVINNDAFKDFFSIDQTTGRVTVANRLIRDLASVVRIPVLVTDITALTMQQGQGMLIVTINDVNDSPPMFLPPWTYENPVYYLELKEELPVGTIVATYKATDEDSDISRYDIVPKSDYFQINNGTGIVQIKKQIDYETTKRLNFTVVAFDSGVPQLNTTALVKVNILNLNDNDPVFTSKDYTASIDENSPNGTFVIAVKAKDGDAEEYGEISYSLIGQHSENFAIDSNGYITVANSNFLDAEIINETEIQVVASDKAPLHVRRSTTMPVHIKINDLNDNPPKFLQKVYNVTVTENVRLTPPVPLIQLNATDEDGGINGHIYYHIISGNTNEAFTVGIDTGILYPQKPLLSQSRQYRLVVEARDGAGNGELFDRAVVNINVLNVNDYKPEFVMPAVMNATIDILENDAKAGYLVLTVKAIDKDDNDNGRVTYHFKEDGQYVQATPEFSIDANTGKIHTRKDLDRETKSKYQLVLVAKDHGNPKSYETANYITIKLVDENDNKPEFPETNSTFNYNFFVTENNPKDIVIGRIRATDKDEGRHANIYYYFFSGNEDESFLLDRSDGTIYANKSFDRELKPEYNLTVIANNDPNYFPSKNDTTNDSSTARIKVVIRDLNDNEPIFENDVYYAAVSQFATLNSFVVNVTAEDPDAGLNGSLTYYIKASNLYKFGSNKSSGSIIPSPFNVSETGEIHTAIHLAENNQHRFILEIVARENAHPEREAHCKVYVWVFESEQLIRIILSRPPQEVGTELDEIVSELRNATQNIIIVHDMKNHTDDFGKQNNEWTDLFILAVNPKTQTIVPVPDVLKIVDSKYDFLKDYYAGFAIENVVPAYEIEEAERFDPTLVALIALLIVLFVGIVTFIVACCCLRHWVLSPTDLKKKDALIKKAIIDDLNTTENPLWIEQKLKIYEEQELTMQVFNEPDQNLSGNRRNSDEYIPDDNTYATIQHPHRSSSHHLGEELADYATLSHRRSGSNNSSLAAPNYYEAALGFQGSTFQVPERLDDDSFGATFKGSELTINHEGQPEYVAELI